MNGVMGVDEAREKFPMRGGRGEELEVRCDGGNGYRVRLGILREVDSVQ